MIDSHIIVCCAVDHNTISERHLDLYVTTPRIYIYIGVIGVWYEYFMHFLGDQPLRMEYSCMHSEINSTFFFFRYINQRNDWCISTTAKRVTWGILIKMPWRRRSAELLVFSYLFSFPKTETHILQNHVRNDLHRSELSLSWHELHFLQALSLSFLTSSTLTLLYTQFYCWPDKPHKQVYTETVTRLNLICSTSISKLLFLLSLSLFCTTTNKKLDRIGFPRLIYLLRLLLLRHSIDRERHDQDQQALAQLLIDR